MYGALWRALPGPRGLKVAQCALLAAAVVVALFAWVFPWVAERTDLADSATMSAPLGPVVSPGTAAPPGPADPPSPAEERHSVVLTSPGAAGAVHNGV